jgi:hypothetical protein
MEERFEETLNIEVVGNSICFLRSEKTQNFDTGQRNQEGLSLEGFSRYDFKLESNFKFLLVFDISFLMQYECMMSCNMLTLYVPHKNKMFTKYRWRTHSQLQIALISVVSSTEIILHNRG